MREYELRVAQKMSMKVSDLFLNNSERRLASGEKVIISGYELFGDNEKLILNE